MIETYLPLYRKYRPQRFVDLVGQDLVSTALANAINLGQVNHAYLFCGPRGTGKTSSARIFAKSLNCENGPTPQPCQTCVSCTAITQGNALDVTEIDAASNNGVDHIRDLTDKVQFSPIQGKYRIYIIDEVHMLSTAAFNALLKTLEEPPPNVVFIFATTEPHKVLPTIVSRCQRFDFSRITRQQIETHLAAVAQKEGIQVAPEALALMARHVRGGLRDALGLLDQVSVLGRSQAGKVITPEDVRVFIGLLEEEVLLEMTQGLQEKDPALVLSQIAQLQARGVEPGQMVKELTRHFRNLLIAKTCGPSASGDSFDLDPDFYQKLCVQSQGFEVEEIPQILSRLSMLEGQLRHSQQPQLWFEVGLLDITYRQDIHLVKQLAERIAALEAMVSGGTAVPNNATFSSRTQSALVATAPKTPSTPAKTASPQPAKVALEPKPEPLQTTVLTLQPVSPAGDLTQTWQQILGAISHSPTRALVSSGFFHLLEIGEGQLSIGYSTETILDTLRRTPEKLDYLQNAVQAVLGGPYKINFVMQKGSTTAPITVSVLPKRSVEESLPDVSIAETSQAVAIAEPVAAVAVEAVSHAPAGFDPATVHPPVRVGAPEEEVEEIDVELAQAKQYTQELLQGRMID